MVKSPYGSLPRELPDVIEQARVDVLAYAVIAGDARAVEFVTRQMPVFPSDNAPDRSGYRWCSARGCGWQPREQFSPDKTRNGYRRYCKACERERAKKRYLMQKIWYDGNPCKNSRTKCLTP